MQDDRTTWMFSPTCIPMDEVAGFVNCHKDIKNIKILLSHIHLNQLFQLNDYNVCQKNLYADTSGFKDGINPVENAIRQEFLKDHLAYGFGAPILEPYVSAFQLETADADDELGNVYLPERHIYKEKTALNKAVFSL